MGKYTQYSREELIAKIEILESENSFLKEYIRGTKEFKDFNRFVENEFGGKNEAEE